MKLIKPLNLYFLAVFFLSFFPMNGYAKQAPQISVKPAKTIVHVQPGGVYSGQFIVSNLANEDLFIDIQGEDWTEYVNGKRIKGIPNWLHVNKTSYTLDSNQDIKIDYEIHLDDDADKQVMSQLFFGPKYSNPDFGNSFQTRIGVLIVAIPTGIEKKKIGSVRCIVETKNETEETIYIQLENLGNVLLKWEAYIEIKSPEGVIADTKINSSSSLLPTQTQRVSSSKSFKDLSDNSYLAQITIDYGIHSIKENQETFTVSLE